MFPQDIKKLAELSQWVYQLWLDETTYGHLLSSADTVKATSCWRTFDARGKGITWAVMDTGINADHPHFATWNTVDKNLSKDFSITGTLDDKDGHGTHVAGIIAGMAPPGRKANPIVPRPLRRNKGKRRKLSIYPHPLQVSRRSLSS